MENLKNYLNDPGWWIGVFFVGILTSILGAVLKSIIDKWLGKISFVWAIRSNKRKELFNEEVKKVLENDAEREKYYYESLCKKIRSISFLIIATIGFIATLFLAFLDITTKFENMAISNVIPASAFLALTSIMASLFDSMFNRYHRVLRQAQKKDKDEQES